MSGEPRHGPSRPPRGATGARASVATVDAARLTGLLSPVVHAAGADLEEVRVTGAGRRMLLRVVVDADGGVDLDTIALISREVSDVLDAGDEFGDAPYTLEVTSPGVDRPLTQPRHWRRAAGRLVSVAVAGVPGRVEGRVAAVSGAGVTLDVDGSRREFGYDDLGPGRVQVEFGRPAGEPGDVGGGGGEPDGH